MKSDKTRAGPSARGGSFEGRGAMSESDNEVFGFGIGGFSQGHSSLEIRGNGDAYSYRHSASLLADTEERRGTLEKSKVDAPMAFLRGLGACDCRKDWRRTAVEAGRNFLHDIDIFVHASPEYVSYGDILAQHGPELDIEQIANRDMSEADTKLLASSIIAVARYDRRCVARVDTF